jgi:SNF family Na+-dependent transporter
MEDGLKFLFIPDLTKLFHIEVWIKAGNQVIYMLGIGYGANILFATSRKQDEHVYLSSFWIPMITVGFGMICAIVNFSFLGHLSKLSGIPIAELPIVGTDLSFITYPGLLCKLDNSNFWSILFFLMMVSLGLDSQVELYYLVWCK